MSIEADRNIGYGSVPSLVTFMPILSAPVHLRLSTRSVDPSRPIESKKLIWSILRKGRSSRNESVLGLKPIERVLAAAVAGFAAAEIDKDNQIFQLNTSVQFRDKVLSSMQQKLDSLCEQMNDINQPEAVADSAHAKNANCDGFGTDKVKSVDCGCWLCVHHHGASAMLEGNSVKLSSGDEVIQHTVPMEPEERRMSDLSDWGSSVTSCADVQQVSSLAEQDSFNLKLECEEKDLIIEDLRTLLHSSDANTKKRIAELEDVIQRKTTTITKIRKDMMVLEQKAMQLTRVSKRSSATSPSRIQRPVLSDNLLYNIEDSTTSLSSSSSSSDSDSSPAHPSRASFATSQGSNDKNSDIMNRATSSSSSRKANEHYRSTIPSSHFKEMSSQQRSGIVSSRGKTQLAGGESEKTRRPNQYVSKISVQNQPASQHAALQKRWL